MTDIAAPCDTAATDTRSPYWTAVHYVYALVDPRDERVRYIGCSINPHERLFRGHCCKSHSPDIREWIAELRSESLRPRVVIIDSAIGFPYATDLESQAIYEYSQFHGQLLNRTNPILSDEIQRYERRAYKWLKGILRNAREETKYWHRIARNRRPRRDLMARNREAHQ